MVYLQAMKRALKRKDTGFCIILKPAQKHPHLLVPTLKGGDVRRKKEIRERKLECKKQPRTQNSVVLKSKSRIYSSKRK